MNGKRSSQIVRIVVVLVGLLSIGASSGCDQLFYPDWTSLYYPGSYYYPSTSLYDPTDLIQGVVDYRLDAMETSANGWSEYILQ